MIKILATFFYVGLVPFAPGTAGSIAGFVILWLVSAHSHGYLYVTISLAILILAFCVSGRAEAVFRKKDAREIVIDEVAGMLLSFFWIPVTLKTLLAGFVLFRVFDIFKPFPIDRLQRLPGSLGIVLDDIMAAVYTNLFLHLFIKFRLT